MFLHNDAYNTPGSCPGRLTRTINVLSVVNHPLGGIRTYLKYVYRNMPGHFIFTVLAPIASEHEALKNDINDLGGRLIELPADCGASRFIIEIIRAVRTGHYDVIHSQGYISACYAYAANSLFGLPHILTAHGILEQRLLRGLKGVIRKQAVKHVLCNIDVLNAVSYDLMQHLMDEMPALRGCNNRKIVIRNGIDVSRFVSSDDRQEKRNQLEIREEDFVIGFFGRFMPEKGFDLLIEAIGLLCKVQGAERLKVLAVGSGDRRGRYRREVTRRGLDGKFRFMPFQANIEDVICSVDAVVMPSLWEALGLLPMESLCVGTPLIVSDCIGLREAVMDTPAIVFETGNATALAEKIKMVYDEPHMNEFLKFVPTARERFDVKKCSKELADLFDMVCEPH